MTREDIAFLEDLAKRISLALYYKEEATITEAIGVNGNVSPGLMHDDYDRLRAIAKNAKIASLRAELAALGETP